MGEIRYKHGTFQHIKGFLKYSFLKTFLKCLLDSPLHLETNLVVNRFDIFLKSRSRCFIDALKNNLKVSHIYRSDFEMIKKDKGR